MVLVNMLMEIDPLPVRGSMVMMMAMIPPFGREVPPAESLRRRAKVLLPKFRLETVALHPESFLMNFFSGQKTPYSRIWGSGACQVDHEAGARPPPSWLVGGPLWCFLRPIFLIYSKTDFLEFQDFWSCAE